MRPPDFWKRTDAAARLTSAILAPLGWIYGATVAYRAKRARPYRSRAKVICVGNLTVGGTGKTPIALEIARLLLSRNRRVVFLTRGYGGHVQGARFVAASDRFADVGDEPLLLAAVAPVIVSRDRAAGARLADEQGFDVVVMDDGHQNFSPAGPLREPVAQGLKRADAVIILAGEAPPVNPSIPLVQSRLVQLDDVLWSEKRVVAFAGIANPERFFSLLADLGTNVVEVRAFPDHHPYSSAEIAQLKSGALAESAALVTTEKDFVRLSSEEREGVEQLRVRAEFVQSDMIDRLLDRVTGP
jgi:tetraacyldisaccharide 4'-kinase